MLGTPKAMERYEAIMESQGSEESGLLGVLDQALHHNFPNSYHLGMVVRVLEGDEDFAFDSVTERVALVNRHIRDAQNALCEIYEVAKLKGYL